MGHCWLWRWNNRLQAKECRQSLEARKSKGTDSFLDPQSKKEHNPADTDFISVKPIPNFQTAR